MSRARSFSPTSLLDFFTGQPEIKRILVAFSGGMDSTVLLHALVTIREELEAKQLHVVHVDHGLNQQSGQWSEACSKVCREYGVPYETVTVDATAAKGESPEASAREARYRAFADMVGAGDCLATAHHQDDQAETLLLQLARGSGPAGLASMAAVSQFHDGLLVRPLLSFSRDDLHAYAEAEGLAWIDDPSNFDRDFDRNYLRHNVLPAIRQRWPNFSRTVSRSAGHIAQAQDLLDQLALSDLEQVSGSHAGCLGVAQLMSLDLPRRNNTIRAWIKSLGLAMPQAVHMTHINQDVLQARQDAQPCVSWPGCEVRRYGNDIYAMVPLGQHDVRQEYTWQLRQPLSLPGVGRLMAKPANGIGLKQSMLDHAQVRVGYRRGGEHCQPAGRDHQHEIKKLFQEFRVPPWERDRVPLIYINGTLACIVGHSYCQGFNANGDEPGCEILLDRTLFSEEARIT